MQESIFTTLILPIALALIMLGMGLSLKFEDFQRITKYPKAVSVGLFGQIVLLPIIGFIITKIVAMPPAIAVGLMIIAIAPGGVSSNMITYLAGGDVALSVTLTVCSSIITIFTIPILANLSLNHFLGQSAAISLPSWCVQICHFSAVNRPAPCPTRWCTRCRWGHPNWCRHLLA